MATVIDVAAYILDKHNAMSTMKLQKLVYYCQAWSLVWDEDILFKAPIQAWANGPVCPVLYRAHRGLYRVTRNDVGGDAAALSKDQIETIDAVLQFYADKEPQWLSDLTHNEAPWKQARAGVPMGERCENEITPEAMLTYYSGL